MFLDMVSNSRGENITGDWCSKTCDGFIPVCFRIESPHVAGFPETGLPQIIQVMDDHELVKPAGCLGDP